MPRSSYKFRSAHQTEASFWTANFPFRNACVMPRFVPFRLFQRALFYQLFFWSGREVLWENHFDTIANQQERQTVYSELKDLNCNADFLWLKIDLFGGYCWEELGQLNRKAALTAFKRKAIPMESFSIRKGFSTFVWSIEPKALVVFLPPFVFRPSFVFALVNSRLFGFTND